MNGDDVRTRTQYVELFDAVSDAIAFEEACLAIPGADRPWFADVVVAGLEPTPEYWAWLADSFYVYQVEMFEQHEADERDRHERDDRDDYDDVDDNGEPLSW